jgi:site-specific DNA recombinase
VEAFDEHDVSFVSVTQSFNTTSSMGRLTLNVLLSFAQFEREVIGERVRDKIAASKRKGIWVGGPVPLGYRSVDKKLEVVTEEADLVRKIFDDYLRLGSISSLAASLNAEGAKPKPRRLASGQTVAAACYRVGPLAHLLKNRFYIGEVAYRGEVHAGEHEPILDRSLFEAVQARLNEQAVERSAVRSSTPAPLAGRIFDDRMNPMTPTHANRNGVRYRYYVSHALLQGRAGETGSIARVSAPDVEALIAKALRTSSAANCDASDREFIENHLGRAVVGRDQIAITLRLGEGGEEASNPNHAATFSVPFTPILPLRKGISHSPSGGRVMDEATRSGLLTAVARTRAWVDAIVKDPAMDVGAIAKQEKLAERHVRFLLPLAYLAPRIIESIAEGRAPTDLTVTRLVRNLPIVWADQENQLGFG